MAWAWGLALVGVASAGGWESIDTEHFAVHYDAEIPEQVEMAQRVAVAAEGMWHALGAEAGVFLVERVDIVLTDGLGGRAQPAMARVELGVAPAPWLSRLRGQAPWPEWGLAHELGHVVAWRAGSAWAPPGRLGLVASGDPMWSVAASVTLGEAVSLAWAEGVAEWMAETAGTTGWTSGRDAVLRMAVAGERLPDFAAFADPTPRGWWADEVRSQVGFAFVRHLREVHGTSLLPRVHRMGSSSQRTRWVDALGDAVHTPVADLYEEWRSGLVQHYAQQLGEPYVEGEVVGGLTGESWHAMARERHLAHATVGGIVIVPAGPLPLKERDTVRVAADFGSRFAWSEAGDDVFVIRDGFIERVRWATSRHPVWQRPVGPRAASPRLSPDGTRVAVVEHRGSAAFIVVLTVEDGVETERVALGDAAVQGLDWAGEADWVVAARRYGHTDLYRVGRDGHLVALTWSGSEERDPEIHGEHIYFVSDVGGRFDAYRMPVGGGGAERLTAVRGGAAAPSLDDQGHMLVSVLTGEGWRARSLPPSLWVGESVEGFGRDAPAVVQPMPGPPMSARPYNAVVRAGPVLGVPVLAVQPGSNGGIGLAGGARLALSDPRHRWSSELVGLLGEDRLVYGQSVVRVGPVRAGVSASHRRGKQWVAHSVLPDGKAATGADHGEARVGPRGWPVDVAAGGGTARVGYGGTPEPYAAVLWAGAAFDDAWSTTSGWSTAVRLETRWARSRIMDPLGLAIDPGLPQAYGWARGLGHVSASHTAPRWLVAVDAVGGVMSRDVGVFDEFRGGAHVPLDPRVDRTWLTFPGYPSGSLAGEAGGVVGVYPAVRLFGSARVGGVRLGDLWLGPRAHAGQVWSLQGGEWSGSSLNGGLLVDAGGTLRWDGMIGSSPWDGFATVAWGLTAYRRAPAVAWTGSDSTASPQVILGLGTGW